METDTSSGSDMPKCPSCGHVMWLDKRGQQAHWRCPCGGAAVERHPEFYKQISSPGADAFWDKLLRDDPRYAPPVANVQVKLP